MRWSISKLHSYEYCPRKYHLSEVLGSNTKSKYLSRGTILHECAELKLLGEDDSRVIRHFDKRIDSKEHDLFFVDKDFLLQSKGMLFNFLNSKSLKAFFGDDVIAEDKLEFIEGDDTFVGVIDLLGDDVIIDFKTSQNSSIVPQGYVEQLHLYSWLVYMKRDKLIKNLYIYYFIDDSLKKVEFDMKLWDNLLNRFRIAKNKIAREEFPPIKNNYCFSCEFKEECPIWKS